ncbi:hypothetical protein ACLOJK_041380 [Asimina triloba]
MEKDKVKPNYSQSGRELMLKAGPRVRASSLNSTLKLLIVLMKSGREAANRHSLGHANAFNVVKRGWLVVARRAREVVEVEIACPYEVSGKLEALRAKLEATRQTEAGKTIELRKRLLTTEIVVAKVALTKGDVASAKAVEVATKKECADILHTILIAEQEREKLLIRVYELEVASAKLNMAQSQVVSVMEKAHKLDVVVREQQWTMAMSHQLWAISTSKDVAHVQLSMDLSVVVLREYLGSATFQAQEVASRSFLHSKWVQVGY